MLRDFCSIKIFWLHRGISYFEKWSEVWFISFVMLVFDLLCVFTLVV
jgi:hypothetical protein